MTIVTTNHVRNKTEQTDTGLERETGVGGWSASAMNASSYYKTKCC